MRAVEVRRCDSPIRTPDALLVSIGGNDIKFSGIVQGVLAPWEAKKRAIDWPLRQLALSLFRAFMGAASLEDGARNARALRPRYADQLSAMSHALGLRPDQTVLVTYPNVVGAEEKGCGESTVQTVDGRRIRDGNMIFGRVIPRATFGLGPGGWTVGVSPQEVRGFHQTFAAISDMQSVGSRGFAVVPFLRTDSALQGRLLCDSQAVPLGTTRYAYDVRFAEAGEASRPRIPIYFCTNPSSLAIDCLNQAPSRWTHYTRDRRIVNSMNDSIMAMRRWTSPNPSTRALFEALAGTMHPTAEAHAEAADNVHGVLKPILRRPRTNRSQFSN